MAGSCWLHCKLRLRKTAGSCWIHCRLRFSKEGKDGVFFAGFTVGLGCAERRVLACFTVG